MGNHAYLGASVFNNYGELADSTGGVGASNSVQRGTMGQVTDHSGECYNNLGPMAHYTNGMPCENMTNGVYEDPGATCVVDQYPPLVDIDFSMLVVISGDVVDTNVIGTHVITYECRPPAPWDWAVPQNRTVVIHAGDLPETDSPTKVPTKVPTGAPTLYTAHPHIATNNDACVLAGCFNHTLFQQTGQKVSLEGNGVCDLNTPCMTSMDCGQWDGGDCDFACPDDYACSYDYDSNTLAWQWTQTPRNP